MKFGRLPDKFNIGHVDVIPESKLCSDLVPCVVCSRVSSESVTCARAHVTCEDCWRLVGDAPDPDLKIFCSECYACVPAVRAVKTEWFLQLLEFKCGGCRKFTGTLDKIKAHLESGRECLSAKGKPAILELKQEEAKICEELERIDKGAEEHDRTVGDFERDIADIEELCKAYETYPKILRAALGASGKIFLKCQKASDSQKFIVVARSNVIHVQCVPFRIMPFETKDAHNDKWLSIGIAPACSEKNIPLKLHIALTVYNRYGDIIVARSVDTYDFTKKEYIHPCFEKKGDTYYDFLKLVRHEDIEEYEMIIDDSLCISVELRPLTGAQKAMK